MALCIYIFHIMVCIQTGYMTGITADTFIRIKF